MRLPFVTRQALSSSCALKRLSFNQSFTAVISLSCCLYSKLLAEYHLIVHTSPVFNAFVESNSAGIFEHDLVSEIIE